MLADQAAVFANMKLPRQTRSPTRSAPWGPHTHLTGEVTFGAAGGLWVTGCWGPT